MMGRLKADLLSVRDVEIVRSGRKDVLQSLILEVLLDIRDELVELNKKGGV